MPSLTCQPKPKRKPGPVTRQKWHKRFLGELRKFPNVSAACRTCAVSRSTANRHKDQFPEFAEAWDDAVETATDNLEAMAYKRALKGTLRPIYQRGKIVGYNRRYSERLIIFMLTALRPEIYRSGGGGRQAWRGRLPEKVETPAAGEPKGASISDIRAMIVAESSGTKPQDGKIRPH